MAMNKENEQLVIIDNKNVVYAFEFETFNQLRLVRHFSISGYVHEASDIAVDKGQVKEKDMIIFPCLYLLFPVLHNRL